jgi:DNA-directed RNA polymerase specialized sigma24 family protein
MKTKRLPRNSPDRTEQLRKAARQLDRAHEAIGEAVRLLGIDGYFAEEIAETGGTVKGIAGRLRHYAEKQ